MLSLLLIFIIVNYEIPEHSFTSINFSPPHGNVLNIHFIMEQTPKCHKMYVNHLSAHCSFTGKGVMRTMKRAKDQMKIFFFFLFFLRLVSTSFCCKRRNSNKNMFIYCKWLRVRRQQSGNTLSNVKSSRQK